MTITALATALQPEVRPLAAAVLGQLRADGPHRAAARVVALAGRSRR